LATTQRDIEGLKVSGSGGIVADSSTLDDLRREVEAIRRDASEAKRTANRTADKVRRSTGVEFEGTSGTAVGVEHSSVITRLVEDVAALKAGSQGTLGIGQLTHDVHCLKYECRRLKDQTTVELRRDIDDLQRHVTDVKARRSGDLKEVRRLVHDVRCLKHETAKLKRVVVVRKAGAGGDLATADQEQVRQQLVHDVRCLKHETAKLKRVVVVRKAGAGADLAALDRDVLVTEECSAVIEEIKGDIEDLRMQISLAGSGGGISQVFVDLPQTAAVQLVFRAQHEGDDAA
jgi:archaellum component FlaC